MPVYEREGLRPRTLRDQLHEAPVFGDVSARTIWSRAVRRQQMDVQGTYQCLERFAQRLASGAPNETRMKRQVERPVALPVPGIGGILQLRCRFQQAAFLVVQLTAVIEEDPADLAAVVENLREASLAYLTSSGPVRGGA